MVPSCAAAHDAERGEQLHCTGAAALTVLAVRVVCNDLSHVTLGFDDVPTQKPICKPSARGSSEHVTASFAPRS